MKNLVRIRSDRKEDVVVRDPCPEAISREGYPWPSPCEEKDCFAFALRTLQCRAFARNDNKKHLQAKSLPFLWILLLLIFLWIPVVHASNLELKDEVGRLVTFPFPPKRIVSLAPNVTEILFSLGLDEEIVGVSIHCNYPEKAKNKARVGSYISLDFEKIASLSPDLIIGTGAGNTRDMVDRLGKLGFRTYVIYPKNFEDILKSITHLGQVVNRGKEAGVITERMRIRSRRVVELTRGLPQPKVFIQIADAPMVTVGARSFADDLIRLAGGENIAGNEKEVYPRFGMEEILKRSPDVIVISSMNPKGDYRKILQEWRRWRTIPAVKNGRVHLIDSDLLDRPSPRIIDGLEELAQVLHPDQLKKKMQD